MKPGGDAGLFAVRGRFEAETSFAFGNRVEIPSMNSMTRILLLHSCHAEIQNRHRNALLRANAASVVALSGGYPSNPLRKKSASRMP
jgi:hypothetical protein